jgi:hypothetical protein
MSLYDRPELNVTVNRYELLEIVQANAEKHRAMYTEALRMYRIKAAAALRDRLIAVQGGDQFNLSFNLPQPTHHAAEYERVIAMLTMHTDQTITLGQEAFARYVRDEWDWKRAWTGTIGSYIALPEEHAGVDDDAE